MNKNLQKIIFTISFLIVFTSSYSQKFTLNDADRERMLKIVNTYSNVSIPTNNLNVLNSFFENNKIEKSPSQKIIYLIKPIYNVTISQADLKFYCEYLLFLYSEDEMFPIKIVREKLNHIK